MSTTQEDFELQMKIMEQEVLIEEKTFAKKRIALEKMKMQDKLRKYDESVIAIDAQIEQHTKDLNSLISRIDIKE